MECVDCHYAPGLKNKVRGKMMGLVQLVKYASLTYKKSRPWAEISDESYLRQGCHETRLLQGRVAFKEGVVFDHAPHLGNLPDGKKLRCTSCHSQIVQGNHMTVTETTCYLCHFKGIKGAKRNISDCTTCHVREVMETRLKQGLMRFDHTGVFRQGLACTNCHSHTVVGNGRVLKQACFNCHWDTERLAKYEDSPLLHAKHVKENKVECIRCHISIEHKIHPAGTESIAECQTCHPKHHDEKIALFTGVGGKGVSSQPNKMMEMGLNCRACHISHGIGGDRINPKAFYASGKSCDKCHGNGFGGILEHWHKYSLDRVAQLRVALVKVEAAAKSATRRTGEQALSMLGDAGENLRIVERGNIVHNVRYANDLMESARNMISDAAKLLGVQVSLPEAAKGDKKPNVGCLECHFYVKDVKPEFAGIQFSHKNHLERGLECQRCHSIAEKHATLIIDKDGCATCHHKKTVAKKCEQCHSLQNDVIQGRWDILDQPSMKSENFACTECHKMTGRKPVPQDCADCHKKPEYAEKMIKWGADVGKLADGVRAGVTAAAALNLTPEQKVKVAKAEAFLNGVTNDGSRGVHNPQGIKKAAKEYLKILGEIVPASNAPAK